MTGSSHTEIFQKDNIPIFLHFINKIYKLVNDDEKIENFTKKKGSKLLNVAKTLTNCLMTKEICQSLDSKTQYNKKNVDEFLNFMHRFHKVDNNHSYEKNKDIK